MQVLTEALMHSHTVLVHQADDAASHQAGAASKKGRRTMLVTLHASQHAWEEFGQEVRLHTNGKHSFIHPI